MEISYFTTPLTDKLCHQLKLDYFPEFLTRTRHPDILILKIPGYRQTKSYTCGFVSGLMVLKYFRTDIDAKSFYIDCQPHDDWGISSRKVANALRKQDLGVSLKRHLTFNQIASEIKAGRPILTSIKRKGQIQHWVVIYGVNKRKKEVYIAGDKFWFSLFKTNHQWKLFKLRLPKDVDFLVCWDRLK